ncbi:hypothetical protein ACFX15_012975 [Malus domestica]
MDEYITEFTKLSCRVIDWTHVFLGGLRDDIRHDVLALEPDSLHQAQKLAKIFETKNQAKHYSRPPLFRPSPAPSFPRPTIPITSPAPLPHPSPYTSTASFKHLTPAQVQDKICKKECFHCTEPYVPSHKCKDPMIVLLDIDTPEDDSHEFHDCNSEEDTTCHMLEFFSIPSLKVGHLIRLRGSIHTHQGSNRLESCLQPVER